jgi:hypothetical protein
MPKWLKLVTATALSVALLLPVTAGAAFAAPRTQAKPTTSTFTGTVSSVNAARARFVLHTSSGRNVTVHVTTKTRFTGLSGVRAVKKSQRLQVRAQRVSGRWNALSITLR